MCDSSRDALDLRFPQMHFVTRPETHEAIKLHRMRRAGTQDMRCNLKCYQSKQKRVISDVKIIRMEKALCCVKCHHLVIKETLPTTLVINLHVRW